MRHWDINEVMTALEWLDIRSDQEYYIHQEQEAQRLARARKS